MPWREFTDAGAHWQFLRDQPFISGAFLQSPAWAEVRRSEGARVAVLGYVERARLAGVAVCVGQRLPLGAEYWLVPKGPLAAADVTEDERRTMVRELSAWARGQKALFVRIEPAAEVPWSRRTLDDDPRATTVVDLARSEEDMLAAMHPKTRYNIRLAERHGLRFRFAGASELPVFQRLLAETARRDGFRVHRPNHYAAIMRVHQEPDYEARLGLVELEGELMAGSLMVACQGTVTYLHGVSSRANRELMAPYLLHWAAMQAFKREGARQYDFWGVEPSDGSLPGWAGFTRFKLGFGGERYEYPGTFDVVLGRGGYALYRTARFARRFAGRAGGI